MKDRANEKVSEKPRSEKSMSSATKVNAWDNGGGQGSSACNTERSHRSAKTLSAAGSKTSQKKDEGGWGKEGGNDQAQGDGWGGSKKGSVAPRGNW